MRLTIASERIADAEATAERQRKLAVKEGHSQGRYDPGNSIFFFQS
jgi:hypothetical protein